MSEQQTSSIEKAVDVAVVALDQGVEHLNSLIYAAAAMAAEKQIDLATMVAKKQKEEMVKFMQEVKNGINQKIVKANKNIEAIRGIIGDPENHEFVNHMLNTGKEELVKVYGIAGTGAELFKERMKAEGLHLQETFTNIAVEKGNELAEKLSDVRQKANKRKEEAKEQLNKLIEDRKIQVTDEASKAQQSLKTKAVEAEELVKKKIAEMKDMASEKRMEIANQTMKKGSEMTNQTIEQGKQTVNQLGTKAIARGKQLTGMFGFTGNNTQKAPDTQAGGKRKNKTRKIRNKKKMKKA
tara:strand:+ start:414 stop:1301 length:888 start_codon:yes stop_codon:yes gene_type:complete